MGRTAPEDAPERRSLAVRSPRLLAASPHDDQADAGDERNDAENRRDGDRLVLIVRDLQGAHAHVLFVLREAEAAQGKANNAEDDKQYTNDKSSFHVRCLFREK